MQLMIRSALTLCTILVAGAPSFAVGQALSQCTVGQTVTDQENKTGVVVSAGNHLCQVKYPDGQVYGWIYWTTTRRRVRENRVAAARHKVRTRCWQPCGKLIGERCSAAHHPQGSALDALARISR